MSRFTKGIRLMRLLFFGVLVSVGHTIAEQNDTIEMQGTINQVHDERGSLVIDDMEYQVPPNIMVNGVTSPRAYLFNLLTDGAVVTLVANIQNDGLRLLEIRTER